MIKAAASKIFILYFIYYPIIEKDIPPAKLQQLKGLVSAVFYMEQQNEPAKLRQAIKIAKSHQES